LYKIRAPFIQTFSAAVFATELLFLHLFDIKEIMGEGVELLSY
jgi:hypothetical protein